MSVSSVSPHPLVTHFTSIPGREDQVWAAVPVDAAFAGAQAVEVKLPGGAWQRVASAWQDSNQVMQFGGYLDLPVGTSMKEVGQQGYSVRVVFPQETKPRLSNAAAGAWHDVFTK